MRFRESAPPTTVKFVLTDWFPPFCSRHFAIQFREERPAQSFTDITGKGRPIFTVAAQVILQFRWREIFYVNYMNQLREVGLQAMSNKWGSSHCKIYLPLRPIQLNECA